MILNTRSEKNKPSKRSYCNCVSRKFVRWVDNAFNLSDANSVNRLVRKENHLCLVENSEMSQRWACSSWGLKGDRLSEWSWKGLIWLEGIACSSVYRFVECEISSATTGEFVSVMHCELFVHVQNILFCWLEGRRARQHIPSDVSILHCNGDWDFCHLIRSDHLAYDYAPTSQLVGA